MDNTNVRKIGFLLGTFDPIHNGHLHILHQVQSFLALDIALLVPLYDAPHKDNSIVATRAARLHMCELACDTTKIQTSSIIIDNKIEGYSIELILAIKAHYQSDKVFYILGSDVFLTILQWEALDEMIELVEFSVVIRDQHVLKEIMTIKSTLEKRGATIHVFDFPIKTISSSFIKTNFKNHPLIKDMIPKAVEKYLKATSLYDSFK